MLLGHKQANVLARFEQHSRGSSARRVLCRAAPSKAAAPASVSLAPVATSSQQPVAAQRPAAIISSENDDGWKNVCELLREKGYDDEQSQGDAGSPKWKLDLLQACKELSVDSAVVLNNVVALGLIMQNHADVRYVMRSEPRILTADLLAWAGLLHSLHISSTFLLQADPGLMIKTAAADCMPTIEHLLRHNPDQRALGQKVKRHPNLLALTKDQLDATEAALRDLGLKPAPMRLLLSAKPVIYLHHKRDPDAYMAEVRDACEELRAFGLEPNEVLPEICSLVARAHPGRSVREKLESLARLPGLAKEDVARVVAAAPGVLLLSCADVQRKWSYLCVVLQGGREALLDYPQYLLMQFSRDIAPAYAYLVQNNQQHRVRGAAEGKQLSLELLAHEANLLRAQSSYLDFLSQWKCDMRR